MEAAVAKPHDPELDVRLMLAQRMVSQVEALVTSGKLTQSEYLTAVQRAYQAESALLEQLKAKSQFVVMFGVSPPTVCFLVFSRHHVWSRLQGGCDCSDEAPENHARGAASGQWRALSAFV
jgi:hypothetical protein